MRIFYLCPDTNEPIGGARYLYRHVDILNSQGFSAYALHQVENFRYTWFENRTATKWDREVQWEESDFLVVPEVLPASLLSRYPIPRKVTFNQNAYYTFATHVGVGLMENCSPYLEPKLVLASMVVSEDNEEYLRFVFPEHKIFRVHYSVDKKTFYPGDHKKNQIAYMPRKHLGDAIQVFNILERRGRLNGFKLRAIDRVPATDVAAILRESKFFFSFGYPEGCPLPPHEAMACKALVVGYHGRGGREMFRPEFSFPVEAGDIIGYVKAAEAALALSSAEVSARTERAYHFVRDNYSSAREVKDVTKVWTELTHQSDEDMVGERDHAPQTLSVIVPALNRRQYLRAAVLSLLAEGLDGLEIIVVDDESTDGTLETVRDLPVRTIRLETNQGPSAARNAGIRAATGDLVAFLDSDDILVPGGLRWRVEYLAKHPEEKAVLGAVDSFIDAKGQPSEFKKYNLDKVYDEMPVRLFLEDGKNGFSFPCPVVPTMFRAEVFRTIGYFDESLRLAEDQDFLCRYLKHHSLPVVRRPVFQYRIHPQNSAIRSKNGYLHGTAACEAYRVLVLKSHGLLQKAHHPG